MTTYSYPSETFAGPPGVSLDLPGDWFPAPMPGTLLAARGPLTGTAAPNVIVRHYSRSATYELTSAVDDLQRFADANPDGRMDPPFQVQIGGLELTAVNLSWAQAEVGRVVQLHLLHAARAGGLVQLLHATGSVGGEQAERDYAVVQGILQSLRITA